MAEATAALGPLAIDQHSSNKTYGTQPWLEPFLIKHSSWYRKHMTREGRRESKAERRGSAASAMLESRRQSVVSQQASEQDAGEESRKSEAS